MAPNPSEADILANRINIALAKSQRLVASWLPPRTTEELHNTKSAEETEREEQEMFNPVPELLGYGASLPKEGQGKKAEATADDKLRKQLLGGKGRATALARGSGPRLGLLEQKKSRPRIQNIANGEDSENEPGRSGLGSKGPKRTRGGAADVHDEPSTGNPTDDGVKPPTMLQSSKRTGSYMDEVLESRRKKRRKRSKAAG